MQLLYYGGILMIHEKLSMGKCPCNAIDRMRVMTGRKIVAETEHNLTTQKVETLIDQPIVQRR